MNLNWLNVVIDNYANEIIMTFVIIILLGIFLIISLQFKIKKNNQRISKLLSGSNAETIEEHILSYNRLVEKLNKDLRVQAETMKEIEEWKKTTLRNIGLIRFNAFDEVGSDLSFAVAILDDFRNGVVLSSIYGRDDSRTFAKPVVRGTSTYRMSGEEENAIKRAMENKKQ